MTREVSRLWTFETADALCWSPEDVRGAGTCVRGAPGCPVDHLHREPLPTVAHLGGFGGALR